jgi:hypothetical protein
MNVKERLVKFFSKTEGINTLTTAQAKSWFGIENVSARISELRQEGYPIYTNVRTREDGTKKYVYRMGKASNSFKRQCKLNGVQPKTI